MQRVHEASLHLVPRMPCSQEGDEALITSRHRSLLICRYTDSLLKQSCQFWIVFNLHLEGGPARATYHSNRNGMRKFYEPRHIPNKGEKHENLNPHLSILMDSRYRGQMRDLPLTHVWSEFWSLHASVTGCEST